MQQAAHWTTTRRTTHETQPLFVASSQERTGHLNLKDVAKKRKKSSVPELCFLGRKRYIVLKFKSSFLLLSVKVLQESFASLTIFKRLERLYYTHDLLCTGCVEVDRVCIGLVS